MTPRAVVTLLEKQWKSIRSELGPRWGEFTSGYGNLVRQLPESPERWDLEQVADGVLDLLDDYSLDYASRLQEQEHGRHIPTGTVRELEELEQICDRFRLLALQLDERSTRPENKPSHPRGGEPTRKDIPR